MYINYNRHPKNIYTSDCVVRAISTAFNRDYLEVRRELNECKRNYNLSSYKELKFIPKYLKNYDKIILRKNRSEKRLTLAEFSNIYNKGSYICKVAHHVVAVIDGYILDTWNSSDKFVYSSWKISNNIHINDIKDVNINSAIKTDQQPIRRFVL